MRTGLTVAITGGARGIGLATARAFHAAGATVAIGDLDAELARQAAASVGPRAIGGHVDVADLASFSAWLDAVAAQSGPIDVLDNNAGIMPIGPFLDERPETTRRQLEVNVLGVLNGMKAALPAMVARRSGHIVNVASAAGKSPVPGGLTYAATKAAVISATESARVEHRGTGVHFTCVMPSFTNTELVHGTKGTRFFENVEPDHLAEMIVAAVDRKRLDVYAPVALRGLLKVSPLLGRTLRDGVNRLIGADRAFVDVDWDARSAYTERVTGRDVG